MKQYEVLWIDDDAEKQDGFLDSAYLEGLNIHYYKTSKQGMEELISKIEQYDAVILDAMVFNESEDEKAALTGLFNSIKKINSLSERKKIPYFIFSGYIDKDEHASVREMLADETIFIKSKDNQALFKAIKDAADEQKITQLKHKYPNQYDMCTDTYLGKKHFDRLHNLVLDIENPSQIKIAQDSLIRIRKIVEAIFTKLYKIGCIPDDIMQDKGWISGSSFFLSGKNSNYTYNQNIIHPVIAFNIFKILSVSQDGSHNEGSNLGVDAYMTANTNTFLYQSTVLLLLDTLDYLKPFIDNNSFIEKNQAKWKLNKVDEIEIIYEGLIDTDESGNYYCGKHLLNKAYVERNNKVGDKIKIIESSDNGQASLKGLYPFYATKYQSII